MKHIYIAHALSLAAVFFAGITQAHATNISTNNAISWYGEAGNSYFGQSMAMADLNNDGYDDIIIGAHLADTSAADTGKIYIVYGQADIVINSTIDSAVEIAGQNENDYFGTSVASAGDINNDGYDDILIGATGYGSNGAVYVLYGTANQLTDASITSAKIFTGESGYGSAGTSVASAGDINNDGYDDILIGAQFQGASFPYGAGAAYLIYGQSTALSSANLSTKIKFSGQNTLDYAGSTVAGIGDINNDTYDDFAIAACQCDSVSAGGKVYIVYGQSSALSSSALASAITLTAEAAEDTLGSSIVALGDINNDTYDDFAIGAKKHDTPNTNSGAVYAILGQASALSSASVSNPVIRGSENQAAGAALAATESFLLVGKPVVNTIHTGSVEIVDLYTNFASISELIQPTTSAYDTLGSTLATGDINGDGYADMITGAPAYTHNSNYASGAAYIMYSKIDADADGTLGSYNYVITSGSDCNDNDATVHTNRTYYADNDTDTLGDADTTISVCSATPPAGYVSNATDTNDSIANNNIEISNDNIDNDADGIIDESNTITENGAHPHFSLENASEDNILNSTITNIRTTNSGEIKVTFQDNSIYTYPIFSGNTSHFTFKPYRNSALVVAVNPKGSNIKVINIFTGEIIDTKTYRKQFTTSTIFQKNLRRDASKELIIVSSNSQRSGITLLRLKNNRIHQVARSIITKKQIAPKQTTFSGKYIMLSNKKKHLQSRARITPTYQIVYDEVSS